MSSSGEDTKVTKKYAVWSGARVILFYSIQTYNGDELKGEKRTHEKREKRRV